MTSKITNFDRLRNFYGVPAKRGRTVRDSVGNIGRITSSNGSKLRVRWQGEKRSQGYYHPCDLDYQIAGMWFLGADFLKRVNARIDHVNKQLSRGDKCPDCGKYSLIPMVNDERLRAYWQCTECGYEENDRGWTEYEFSDLGD